MPERVGRSLPEVLARLEVLAQASRNQMTNGQESHAPKQRVWQPPTEAAVRQLLRASGLMTKELQYSLSSARPPQGRYAHQAQAQALLREFLAEAEAGRQEWRVPSWGLVLQSREKGTGKSYLLQALVADLCRLGIPALFVVEGEMMEWLRRANKPCAEFGREQVRQRYWRAPVLVVDDLTTDKASEYSASYTCLSMTVCATGAPCSLQRRRINVACRRVMMPLPRTRAGVLSAGYMGRRASG